MVDTITDTTAAPTAPKPGEPAPAELIIVSGLSGSGKTVALRKLEDLGYYCVDNLPAALMPAFVQALSQGYVYDDVVIPLLVLYLGGILYGGHANKVWLLTLYERRVRGVRMLGWVAPQPVASRSNGVSA